MYKIMLADDEGIVLNSLSFIPTYNLLHFLIGFVVYVISNSFNLLINSG